MSAASRTQTVLADERFTRAILRVVADSQNADVTELTPPLFEAVDPDALDRLLEHASGDVCITFEYAGSEVVARSDGRITVRDPRDEN